MARWLDGVRLAGYGAAYFFASGAFMSYWPVWLRDRGITDAEIGTLFMSRQLVSVRVDARASAGLAHRSAADAACIAGAAAAAAIVMIGAYQLSYTFLALLLVSLVWGCVWCADHGALRRRAGERGQGARLRLRQPARLGLGGLHRRHVDLRRGGRPLSVRPGCSMSRCAGIVMPAAARPCCCRRPSRSARGRQARAVRHPRPVPLPAVPAVHDRPPASASRAMPCSTASAR